MSPAWSGSPERCENRSPTVTIRVTAGSDSANHGSLSTTGVSQPIDALRRPGGRRRWRRAVWTPTPAGTPCRRRPCRRLAGCRADAETLGVQRLSAVHHRDRHPRDAGGLHQLVGDAVELGDRVVNGVVRQRHRRAPAAAARSDSASAARVRWRGAAARGQRGEPARRRGASRQSGHGLHRSASQPPPRVRSPATVAAGTTRPPGLGTATSTPAPVGGRQQPLGGLGPRVRRQPEGAPVDRHQQPAGVGVEIAVGPHGFLGIHVDVGPGLVVGADRQQRQVERAVVGADLGEAARCSRCRRRSRRGAAAR